MGYQPSGGFAVGRLVDLGFPGNLSRNGAYIARTRVVQSTDASSIPFGSPVALNPNDTVSLWGAVATTLTTALALSATTVLDVVALTQSAPAGANVVLTSGTNTQTAVLADAAAVGATSLTVVSFTPTYAYPIGSGVNIENTLAQLVGIALREVQQALDYMPASGTPGAEYAPGSPCDVLEFGTAVVTCQLGTPTAGGPVYLRVALNNTYPNAVVGGWEAEADGTNNIAVTQAKWTTGNLGASNQAEVTLLQRALP